MTVVTAYGEKKRWAWRVRLELRLQPGVCRSHSRRSKFIEVAELDIYSDEFRAQPFGDRYKHDRARWPHAAVCVGNGALLFVGRA